MLHGLAEALVALAVAAAGIVAGFALYGAVARAGGQGGPSANHPKDNYHQNDRPENPTGDYHIRTIHGGNWEDWCAEVLGDQTHQDGEGNNLTLDAPITSMSLSSVQSKFDDTVRLNEPTNDWHHANGDSRLHFNLGASAKSCSELATATRDSMDLEVWGWGPDDADEADNADICGLSYGTGCVWYLDWFTNYAGPVVHVDYQKVEIHIWQEAVDGLGNCPTNGVCERKRHISHEVGHAFGLDDCHSGETCGSSGVMHQSSPPSYHMPQTGEMNTVTDDVADRATSPGSP